jgi:hypothetical protein
MKKLRLNLDDLEVEGFATTPLKKTPPQQPGKGKKGRGTVVGYAPSDTQAGPECTFPWCTETCIQHCASVSVTCSVECSGTGCTCSCFQPCGGSEEIICV